MTSDEDSDEKDDEDFNNEDEICDDDDYENSSDSMISPPKKRAKHSSSSSMSGVEIGLNESDLDNEEDSNIQVKTKKAFKNGKDSDENNASSSKNVNRSIIEKKNNPVVNPNKNVCLFF